MILYQSWQDIKKEGIWVLVYAIVMMVILTILLIQLDSFYAVWKQNYHLKHFEEKSVYCAMPYVLRLKDETENEEQSASTLEGKYTSAMKVLQENCEKSGNIGSYILIPNDMFSGIDEEYKYLVILVGKYAELMGVSCESEVQAYVADCYKESVGKKLTVNGMEISISEVVKKGFDMFHILYYVPYDGWHWD